MDVSKVPDIHPDRQPPRNAQKRRRPPPDKRPEPGPDEKPGAAPAPEGDGHIDVTV